MSLKIKLHSKHLKPSHETKIVLFKNNQDIFILIKNKYFLPLLPSEKYYTLRRINKTLKIDSLRLIKYF